MISCENVTKKNYHKRQHAIQIIKLLTRKQTKILLWWKMMEDPFAEYWVSHITLYIHSSIHKYTESQSKQGNRQQEKFHKSFGMMRAWCRYYFYGNEHVIVYLILSKVSAFFFFFFASFALHMENIPEQLRASCIMRNLTNV